MQNAGLDEAQDRIKIAGRNNNNFRYANNTSLTAESEGEVKSLSMKVKEESETTDLKHNIQTMRTMAHHFKANNWEKNGNSDRLHFLGLQNHCGW